MDKKISQLTAASTPLTGTEELAIVQSGVTKKTTIEDVKGYKVYTALLTQSGGSVVVPLDSGVLTVGITYEIVGEPYSSGCDFTNVGAPNNEVGTKFVATGTIPNSWGVLEGQETVLFYNTGAPVVTVLENTIGNIWFTYGNPGIYTVNCSNVTFNQNTYMIIGNPTWDAGIGFIQSGIDGSIGLITTHPDFLTGPSDCGLLVNTPIEIRVYN